MKYSLKNRQFKKRNHIFGDRHREQSNKSENHEELAKINQIGSELEESKITMQHRNDDRRDKIYQFINFKNKCTITNKSSTKIQQRQHSEQPRNLRHSLSPISKPLVSNYKIPRECQGQSRKPAKFKHLELESSAINFYYRPEKTANNTKEIKQLFLKLYSIILKNNQRIDQIQKVIAKIFQSGQQIGKQIFKGMQKVMIMDQKTSLLFNTMRSVYEDLRICKLKQENIELYLKQQSDHNSNLLQLSNISPTIKQPKAINSSSRRHLEQSKLNQHKDSKQLVRLIQYQSDSSLNQINFLEQISIQRPQDFKFSQSQFNQNFNNFRQQESFRNQFQHDTFRKNTHTYEQLSPFEANKMISSPNNSINESVGGFTRFSSFQDIPKYKQNQGKTMISHLKNSISSNPQEQKFRLWIQNTHQIGLRCWLDEMGCLRRSNGTYIFNSNGDVITISHRTYQRLVEEGILYSEYP